MRDCKDYKKCPHWDQLLKMYTQLIIFAIHSINFSDSILRNFPCRLMSAVSAISF